MVLDPAPLAPAPVRVAVVRSDNRREAIAEALALVADDVRRCVTPRVLIKPNLVSHTRQLPSTHADALSATLDAVLAAGADEVLVAEGASDATAGFDRLGHRRACSGRPVSFFDINRDETEWDHVALTATDGTPTRARVSRTVAEAPCRVSLALAKTHVTAIMTLGLKNMLSSLHPDDRVLMHGSRPGSGGPRGWRGRIQSWLKRDDWTVNLATRSLGRARNALCMFKPADYVGLNDRERGFLRTVEAMNRNLVALSSRVKPHLTVIDGFVAMHREGPRHGTPIRLGTAIVGTDAVAVDAVAAAVMGFDPRDIGYLAYAQAAGLGTADLDAIEVVGDPIAAVRRGCVPHSNYRVQRHWRHCELGRRPSPHRPVAAAVA